MPACIYYHQDAYTTVGRDVMGRQVAGESFLEGYFRHRRPADLWVQVEDRRQAKNFEALARRLGRGEQVHVIDRLGLSRLARAGNVFHPHPGIASPAHQRSVFGHSSWSLCGITHTTASALAMDAITSWITAPVQPWDAVICTSEAVRGHVRLLLQAESERLRQRLGLSQLVLPQLPVIPLGVHCQAFEQSETIRAATREKLHITAEQVVVLFVGRLSFHAKAHPLAMYQALERAAVSSDSSVLLIECGWHANEAICHEFDEAARRACPSVEVRTLDGRLEEQRHMAWAVADVFCSLADNIQETFGLTPVEAMAAGLPVVVSDWDGYRDTVRDGIDGFRIPTVMAPAGLGRDLAHRHAIGIDSYDRYCGYTSSFVAVDVEATVEAFSRLFSSVDLRREMGEAGRRHAKESFDWSVIIPRYEALDDELTERRRAAALGKIQTRSEPWPARLDPFLSFAGYPTRRLEPSTVLSLVDPSLDAARRRLEEHRSLEMVAFSLPVLAPQESLEAVLRVVAEAPHSAADLVAAFPIDQRPLIFRSLVWLLKLGLLKIVASPLD